MVINFSFICGSLLPVLHHLYLLLVLRVPSKELPPPNLHPEDSLRSTQNTERNDDNDLDRSRCGLNGCYEGRARVWWVVLGLVSMRRILLMCLGGGSQDGLPGEVACWEERRRRNVRRMEFVSQSSRSMSRLGEQDLAKHGSIRSRIYHASAGARLGLLEGILLIAVLCV